MAKNPILRFFDFLAKMGIMVRDDPPKVIDVAARSWGDPVDGFVLSIEQIAHDENAPPTLSVVLRNVSPAAQTLAIPGWLHYYHFDMTAPLSPFGRELLKPERSTADSYTTTGRARRYPGPHRLNLQHETKRRIPHPRLLRASDRRHAAFQYNRNIRLSVLIANFSRSHTYQS